ncbi:hypothetical protein MHYP_G00053080 [Metynnis hypsauchen]
MPRKSKKSQAKKVQWKLLSMAPGKEIPTIQFEESMERTENSAHPSPGDPQPEQSEITVRASFSQDDERFPVASKNKQCVANSLMFLAHLYEVDEMDGKGLDCVLMEGDELYRQIRRAVKTVPVSGYLNFDELPDTVATNRGQYTVVRSNPVNGLLVTEPPPGMEMYLNLSRRLQSLGSDYAQALMLVGATCISVFKDRHGRYGYFDPHAQSHAAGKAVMVTFGQKGYAMSYFKKRYAMDERFRIAHRMAMKRCFLLRSISDLKAQHIARCAKHIKMKYRSALSFCGREKRSAGLQIEESDLLIKEAQSLFKLHIQQGPTYACTVCHPDVEKLPEEQQDNEEPNCGISFDSCLQPADVGQEILSFGQNIYSIAPAEGNQPASFFRTPKLEAMAFPVQFNTGKNTLDELDRPKKISPSRYFNARLFSADNRFAMDTIYIFFAQFVTEMHLAMSSMSIQLRKGKVFTKDGRKINTSLLKDQREVEKLVSHGEATRFMQPLRGTPAYWERTMKDLFAMLRQLGIPTFFCTFSAAEMRWPEMITTIKKQQGETVDFDELDWLTKCEIIQSNPVTVIRLFEKRVEALMRDLILSPAQPIGEVVDMFYRVEFQARGSGHIHCLFWIKDAPEYGKDDDCTVTAFIDNYISCQLPDEQTDLELHNIVKDVQSHSRNHTKSCKKGKRHCRFGFPKPPVKSTFITQPGERKTDGSDPKAQSKSKLKIIWDCLNDPAASFESTDALLSKCNMTYKEFFSHLNSLSETNVIMQKREIKDCWINGYNPHLLRAWNANMDIQFILNPYSCIMYMLSYITKAEHEMSEYLKQVVKEASNENDSELEDMKKIMQAYSKNREVSVQEAVTRVCSLKLKSCSRNVVFIPTDENALKMSLPMKCLETKDPHSENVWMTGLPEKYKARPQTPEFESMCMADFASNYRLVYGRQKSGKNVLPLQDNMGFIQKRTKGKPAVIRYTRFSQKKDPEKFYGTLLKLYLPYRSDDQLKANPANSYAAFYACAYVALPGTAELLPVHKIVETNRERFEKSNEAVEHAIEEFSAVGPVEDAWASLAPNSELVRIECISERQPMDPDEMNEQDDVPEYNRNVDEKSAVPLIECPQMSPAVVRQMYQNLNQTQAAVFYKVREWCMKLTNGDRPEQFFYFVTGGAGTGKSHLIKCIYNEATKILRRLPSLSEQTDISVPTVLLTSFTGTAAFNISGNTLHSIFKLPRNLKPPYQGLGNMLDELRVILSHVQIIVIDEISMVSKELFAYVDWRLQQIKGRKTPFGGVSVLAVGDFFQLPPIGKGKALCISENSALDIWKDQFQIITLTEIMRQKEDVAFAEMLNRLRVKKKCESLCDGDRDLLATRTYANKADCPPDVLHIFATNKEVKSHNCEAMSALFPSITQIDAEDYMKDERTGEMKKQATPFQGHKGDLADTLPLSEGARVVLTRNLDIEDGLVNGTFGRVSKIVSKAGKDGKMVVDLIGLKLDNPSAGTKRCKRAPQGVEGLVYIERLEERTKKKGYVRRQFPMTLAYACTSHKVQGMTSTSAVVSLKRIFEPGMAYVALSRTTSLQGLHIIDFSEKKIFCNEEILSSLESMPKVNMDGIMPLLSHVSVIDEPTITVIHHNVEGLHCHFDDMRKHHEICRGDVLCFTETHMFGSAVPQDLQLEGYSMYKHNRNVSYSNFPDLANQKGGGVAVYVKSHLTAQRLQYLQGVTDMEFLALKITAPVRVIIVAVYRPPSYSITDFLKNMEKLLEAFEIMDFDHIILCGDFNENQLSRTAKPVHGLLSCRGYTQLIDEATTEKSTLLDLMFTSCQQKCIREWRTLTSDVPNTGTKLQFACLCTKVITSVCKSAIQSYLPTLICVVGTEIVLEAEEKLEKRAESASMSSSTSTALSPEHSSESSSVDPSELIYTITEDFVREVKMAMQKANCKVASNGASSRSKDYKMACSRVAEEMMNMLETKAKPSHHEDHPALREEQNKNTPRTEALTRKVIMVGLDVLSGSSAGRADQKASDRLIAAAENLKQVSSSPTSEEHLSMHEQKDKHEDVQEKATRAVSQVLLSSSGVWERNSSSPEMPRSLASEMDLDSMLEAMAEAGFPMDLIQCHLDFTSRDIVSTIKSSMDMLSSTSHSGVFSILNYTFHRINERVKVLFRVTEKLVKDGSATEPSSTFIVTQASETLVAKPANRAKSQAPSVNIDFQKDALTVGCSNDVTGGIICLHHPDVSPPEYHIPTVHSASQLDDLAVTCTDSIISELVQLYHSDESSEHEASVGDKDKVEIHDIIQDLEELVRTNRSPSKTSSSHADLGECEDVSLPKLDAFKVDPEHDHTSTHHSLENLLSSQFQSKVTQTMCDILLKTGERLSISGSTQSCKSSSSSAVFLPSATASSFYTEAQSAASDIVTNLLRKLQKCCPSAPSDNACSSTRPASKQKKDVPSNSQSTYRGVHKKILGFLLGLRKPFPEKRRIFQVDQPPMGAELESGTQTTSPRFQLNLDSCADEVICKVVELFKSELLLSSSSTVSLHVSTSLPEWPTVKLKTVKPEDFLPEAV